MKPSFGSRLFVDAMALVGCLTCIDLLQFQSTDPLRFLYYLALGMSSAALQFRLAGVREAMPIYFLFTMLGLGDLSRSEFVVVAFCSACIQALWRAKPTRSQVLFEMTVSAVGAGLAHGAYQFPVWGYVGADIAFLPRFTAGALVFGICHSLAMASRQSLLSGTSMRREWREGYGWSPAYYAGFALLTAALLMASRAFGWRISWVFLPAVYLICYAYRLYIDRLDSERRHAEETAALHLRTIEALALAIDANDHAAHDHLRRVQTYALEVGKDLGLSRDELEALRAAALLHDIGKLAVPEHIISKPGKLAPEEFEKMKVHPIVGAEILETARFPYPVVPIVRSHHEKWDGSGYPDGLRGEQIPVGARILTAVDCLDAMASDRQYRRALPLDQAMEHVAKLAGKDFDPKVVEILKRRYVELEAMAHAQPELQTLSLSKTVKVERGAAPDAGFEQEAKTPSTAAVEGDFLASIAAARQEAQTLFELSHDLGKSLSLDDTLSVVSARLRKLVPYDAIAIWIREGDVLIPKHVSGENFKLFASLEIPIGQGLSGWVVHNKKTILNGNPSVEPGYLNDPSKFSTLRSAISVPLDGLNGVVGALSLYRSEVDAFNKDHLRVLLAISSKIALSVENAMRFQQAQSSATTDYLTGLPNARSLFMHLDRELARCKRTSSSIGVMVCDLNGFKAINDRFGHLEGNKVLRLFAQGVQQACREYDYVARMGGDEFVIVAPGLEPEAAQDKARRLNDIAKASGFQVSPDAALSVSVGCAFFMKDGMDAEQLLAEADRRMYSVKQIHHEREAAVTHMSAPSTYTSAIN